MTHTDKGLVTGRDESDTEESARIIQAIDDETGFYDEIEYEPNVQVSGKSLWDLRGLAEEALELKQSFNIRWDADMRARKRWQAVDPEKRKLIWPDHADLCVWLLEQREAALSAEPVVGVEAIKRNSVDWYFKKYETENQFAGMPSDREVMFDLIDHLASKGHLKAAPDLEWLEGMKKEVGIEPGSFEAYQIPDRANTAWNAAIDAVKERMKG